MNANSSLSRKIELLVSSWFGRLSSAVVDQAIFSGGNFLINVLLARWLGPEGYGAYAVAYAWLMLAFNIYDALLIEPMAIFGSGKYAKQFKTYLGHLYYAHVALTVVIAVVMGIGAWLSYQYDTYLVFLAMAGAALTIPFFMTRWLTRQPFYVLSTPHWSAVGGFIFMVVTVILIAALQYTNLLNPFNTLLVMGIAATLGSIFVSIKWLKPDLRLRDTDLSKREILHDHVHYGKWSAPSRILGWLPGNIFFIVLPIAVGLEANATLRAIGNLFTPLFLLISAIGGVLMPSFVRAYENHGVAALRKRIHQAILLGVVAIGSCALFLMIFGQTIVHVLYDGQYDVYTTIPILVTMAIFPVLDVIQQMLDIGLRAMGLVRLTFIAKVVWGVGTITIGIAMMFAYGLLGTNLGQLITAAIALAVTFWFYNRHILHPRKTHQE